MNSPGWHFPTAPLRASAVTSKLLGLAAVVALAAVARAAPAARRSLPAEGGGAVRRDHGPVDRLPAAAPSVRALRRRQPDHDAAGDARRARRRPWSASRARRRSRPRAVAASVAVTAARRRRRLARAPHRRSRARFGARFDMEIDALLILALSILAWRHGKAGAWVVAVRPAALRVRRRRRRSRRGCARRCRRAGGARRSA